MLKIKVYGKMLLYCGKSFVVQFWPLKLKTVQLICISATLWNTIYRKMVSSNSIKNARIYAGCTYRNVATMENQDWSHRHATWEVNAFLMLPTGCCQSYNTQSARLHQQLNAFLMSTLPTMAQFVTLLQYPKWWKPDCTSMQPLKKCTRTS